MGRHLSSWGTDLIPVTFIAVVVLLASGASAPLRDDPLANRGGQARDDVLRRFGGTRKTEQAVADGLVWLAAHQRPDGVWDRRGFGRMCPKDDPCSQAALTHLGRDADVGLSALAALAFLGAGHTHEQGEYAENLSRVFSYILAQQDSAGSFSAGSGFQMYNDAIATIAVAEAFAMTKDPVLDEPLRRAIGHLVRSQQRGGGWDYTGDTTTNRNDTSITSWVVMAFKSARAAGVSVPLATRLRLIEHFDRAVELEGRVWYADKSDNIGASANRPGYRRRYGPAMIATSLFARSAFGFRLDDALSAQQIDQLSSDLPSLDRLRQRDSSGLHSAYYWYYGTLGMFNVGGESWSKWNAALRRSVLEYQERPVTRAGRRRHSFGSWPAFGRGWGQWGRTGSRVYSTAINTLTLEVYYRYVPAYLSPRGLIGPADLRRHMAALSPAEHGQVLSLARRMQPDTAEPALLDLLSSLNAEVRVEAAIALGSLGSPMARSALTQADRTAPPAVRQRIATALDHIKPPAANARYGLVTEVSPQARMMLFDTGGRALYYRQGVSITRDGREIATARVNRRFSSDRAAAARIVEKDAEVKIGDAVASLRDEP